MQRTKLGQQSPIDPKLVQAALDLVAKHGSIRAASRVSGIALRTLENRLNKAAPLGLKPSAPEEKQEVDPKLLAALLQKVRAAKRLVITAAQNATPVNRPFFESLLGYCKHNDAQLIVVPYRYHNPTSLWSKKAEDQDWWAPELAPYLLNRRIRLNKHLIVLGDIKTQPTAQTPLQGMESLTGSRSAIIGHPKLELMTVPTPQEKLPKILTTTGAVTKKNYTPTKAGKKGEFHHTFGACIVELDGSAFHLRQINAMKDGSFMDLRWEYRGAAREDTGGIAALIMGDTHVKFIDPAVVAATWGNAGIIATLEPEKLVWHDLHDGYSHNHWVKDHLITNIVKHRTGSNDIQRELRESFEFLAKQSYKYPRVENIIVDSNHPRWLGQWLNSVNPRHDIPNVVFWAETLKMVADTAQMTDTGARAADPFVLWGKRMLDPAVLKRTRFLALDESCIIKGIECGMHGDRGANGAKGSPRTFARLGVKNVTGDGHSPWIKEGAYRVGTSTRLKMQYTAGPSSWLHTHGVIYKNGKRSLINIINGEWHA